MDDRLHNRIETGGELVGPHLTPKQLTAYLNGDLNSAEQSRYAAHLETCPLCARERSDMRATIALLSALPLPRPARSFQLNESHVHAAGPWWERFGLWLLPALPALRTATIAAALLLVTVSVGDVLWDQSGNAPMARNTQVEATAPPQSTATGGVVATRPPDLIQANTTEPTVINSFNQPSPTATLDKPVEQATKESDEETSDSADSAAPATAGEPTRTATGEVEVEAGADAATGAGATSESAPNESAATEAAATGQSSNSSEEPQSDTDAYSSDGDSDSDTFSMAEASEGSPETDDGANSSERSVSIGDVATTSSQSPTTSPTVQPTASPKFASSPTAQAISGPTVTSTPSVPLSDTSSTASDDSLSWWRIAQLASGFVLILGAVTVIFLGRLRQRN